MIGAAPAAAAWALRCERACVRRGAREVLSDVSLEIDAGESVCVIGPNGAGKTTLLLALLGLLPLCAGEILCDARPLRRLSARRRARRAAYVPQFVERIPAFSVRDVVAAGRFPHVSPLAGLTRRDEHAIDAALETCGLTSLAARSITQLSGGERQKTLLAAALAQQTPALFLDEPLAGLDPAAQIEVVELLRRLSRTGHTLVMTTHDLHVAGAVAGRIVALRAGRVAAAGTTVEILTSARLADIYGAPFERFAAPGGQTLFAPRWCSAGAADEPA